MSEDVFALIDAGDAEGVRSLLAHDPEAAAARDAEGLSALRRAFYRGNGELVAAVLEAKPPLDGFDAALVGDLERIAEPDSWSEDGFTPLHLAAFAGQADAARTLLERGADPDSLARHAQIRVRPLQTATAFGGQLEVARILLEHGADPNGRGGEGGSTPLHNAAQSGNPELVRLLLDHGADPTLANDEGKTAADYAASDAIRGLL
jgi:ankyrin repeat protein